MGRKNAKTALAACIALLHLVGPEAVADTELYSAALSKEQASITYKFICLLLDHAPQLDSYVVRRATHKQLENPHLQINFEALSSESKTKYGLSPSLVIFDELGEVEAPTYPLYEALDTAAAAEEGPLTVVISTQAATDTALLSTMIDSALAGNDPSTVLHLFTAPDDCDLLDVDAIKAANPAFGDFQSERETLASLQKAKSMPALESSRRRYMLNQRVHTVGGYVTPATWARNAGPGGLTLEGAHCFGGLDLSAVNDLTAFVLVGKVKGVWVVECWFWLPNIGLDEKSEKDMVPYTTWRDQGFIQASPGSTISYAHVAETLRGIFDRRNIVGVNFDRWRMAHLLPHLEAAGFSEDEIERFHEFGQGYQSMTPALRDLEAELIEGRLAHGDNPVLRMCALNGVIEMDHAENRRLTKKIARGRIDGLVALVMAMGLGMTTAPDDDGPDLYQMLADLEAAKHG